MPVFKSVHSFSKLISSRESNYIPAFRKVYAPCLLSVTAVFSWGLESCYFSPAVNIKSLEEVNWIVFTASNCLVFLYSTSPNLSYFTQLFIKCESHSGTSSELILAIKCLQLLIKHMIKFQETDCEWKGNTKCSAHTLKSTPVVSLREPVTFHFID